jgi:Stigma-specific protein, Stig1
MNRARVFLGVAFLMSTGVLGATALPGCGSSGATGPRVPAADSGRDDATIGEDAGTFFGVEGGSPAEGGRGGDDSGSGGTCTSCAPGQSCLNGACVCPTYQTLCNGSCISTSQDPSNCGGCGTKCTGSQVCSAGACSSGCLSGLTGCNGACIDLNDDSNNCGSCMHPCGSGTGCAGGTCVPAAALNFDAGAVHCTGGGDPIDVGLDGGSSCTGNLAQVSFRWALCSCTNLDISAPLTTDGYDSTKGPPDGGLGGSVGCDLAPVNWSQSVSVGGDLWSADAGTFQPSGPGSEVRSDLHLGGTISASSPFTVDDNAYVVGGVSGVTVLGATSHPATIASPCDCAPQQLVPVTAIVAAHRPPNDDNGTLGLDPNIVSADAGVGSLRIDLPCGNYYFANVRTSNPVTIFAHGHVGIYIDGDVTGAAPLAFQLDPTATLDIFITGTIDTSQLLTIGSPNYPALCRLYVGGTAKLAFSQNVNIGCNIYAADSQLVDWSATSAIYGSIFAGNFKASHDTFIHFDRGVLGAGTECPPPGGGSGSDGGSATDGGPHCGSCRDCGNQACVGGTCASCVNDSDCCAPLQCSNGTCIDVVVPR